MFLGSRPGSGNSDDASATRLSAIVRNDRGLSLQVTLSAAKNMCDRVVPKFRSESWVCR